MNGYVRSFVETENHPEVEMIRTKARQDGVPIMQPVAMATVLQLLTLHKPNKILEVGTAVAYSSIKMALALPNIRIVTIERDESMYEQAMSNVKKLGLDNRINIIYKDALEAFEIVKDFGPFDALLIDAAKAQYKNFFEIYEPLVKEKGLILTDNILFRGLVYEEAETIDSKRIRRLVQKIDEYNHWLNNHPSFQTVFLPVDDGIAVTIKQ